MDKNDEYCAALVREADRDRYLATLFAPADRRGALFSLYAFDIEISRIRELAREPMPGEIRLQWWREVLEGERAGEAAANPVAVSLLATLARYRLTSQKLVDLVEAHRFDVYDEPMPTLSSLETYASNTAGTIFDCAARILDESAEVKAIAWKAGQARTLASVIASLPRCAARRQLYVPLDMLRQYGASPDDMFAMHASPELRKVIAGLRLRARAHLARIAELSIPEKIGPAFLSLAPLRTWLNKMEGAKYRPFHPLELPAWRRQWRIWRAAKSLDRIGR